ncbi:MAG: polysaccharide biosynthesis tyrosine autokinase [Rhodobacterales bacterium]|nr:polysaccharide biosynthesis tyrosine autokinase [Rhodobacterales bacterium]
MRDATKARLTLSQLDTPQTDHAPERDIDILSFLRALWRGKVWIILFGLIGLALGFNQAYRVAVPLYKATAQMVVQVNNEPVVNLDTVISGVSGDEYSMNTEMEIIRSTALIGRLVDQLDLVSDPEFNPYLPRQEVTTLGDLPRMALSRARDLVMGPPPLQEPDTTPDPATIRDDTIAVAQGAFTAETMQWSYIFTISAVTQDPEKSALLANTLAQIYRDDQISIKVEATQNAAIWLSERVSALQVELENRQNEINDLRSNATLISPEALDALNRQAIDLRSRLSEEQSRITRLADQMDTLKAAAATDDATVKAATAGDSQLDAILASVTRGEDGAQTRFDRRFDQIIAQGQIELDRARSQEAAFLASVERLTVQIDTQSANLVRLQQLEREADATRVLYETFLTRLKETTVQQGAHQADSRILSAATSGYQVAPRRMLILGSHILVALLAGTGLVLLREMLQNTVRSPDELERLTGRTVLGQIPVIPARGRVQTIRYLIDKPTSAAAEAVRNLRTSVLLSNVDNPPRVIMSTSSVPGEGKTTLAIALAQNLAGLGKKVLLVEGDIRRRTFDAYFPQIVGQDGILAVVSGKTPLAEAVRHLPDMGIDILMGEKSTVNAADVFSSESFQTTLDTMRAAYDYIIIDTPPVLVVPDARVIGPLVDAVVYTVRWDNTPRAQVQEGLKQFRSVNIPVTGLVLSQINPRGMKRYGYGDQYGAYSRYARGYYDS